jgi:AcrR family transcriptional regulator
MNDAKPLRADARRNRDAIVAAARAAFDSGEQLRFDDFAAKAGVGVGTLYRHFPNRESLAAAVYRGEVTALCERAQDPARPPAESLDAFIRDFVEYIVEHAALARALATAVDPAVQADGGTELEQTVAGLVERGARDGSLRPDVIPGAVMVVLHGIGAAADRSDWAEESRGAAELLIRGLKPR